MTPKYGAYAVRDDNNNKRVIFITEQNLSNIQMISLDLALFCPYNVHKSPKLEIFLTYGFAKANVRY